MLFLFRGHHGPAVRAGVGVVFVVVGTALHAGALLTAFGVVLLVWGAAGESSDLRKKKARRPPVAQTAGADPNGRTR
jgi:hypothetical protein